MKRTPLKKKTPLKQKPYKWKIKEKKPKKKLFSKKESKTEEWSRIKREITPFFIENNLYNICELQLEGCLGNSIDLTFAHSKKRGDIAKDEPQRTKELKEVVRACANCHYRIEYIPKNEGGRKRMYEIVTEQIKRRNKLLGLD